jgi:hypothetical protein
VPGRIGVEQQVVFGVVFKAAAQPAGRDGGHQAAFFIVAVLEGAVVRVDDGGQTAQRVVLVVGAIARWAGDAGQLPVLVPFKAGGALQGVVNITTFLTKLSPSLR